MTLARPTICGLLTIVLALVCGPTSLAASQAQIQAAQSVVDATAFERRQRANMELPNTGNPVFDKSIEQMKGNPGFQAVRNSAAEVLPKIRDQVAEIYANKFTEGELGALTKFFLSPIGQKYVTLLPELQLAEAKLILDAILKSDPKIADALESERRRQAQVDTDRASLELQANAGNPEAMYRLGTTYCSSPSPADRKDGIAKCFAWKTRAAEKGLTEAQFDVGFSYVDGRYGNQKSGVEMFRWLKRAADNGHSGAAFYVGSAYAGNIKVFGNQPTGVDVNAKEAESWLQKAAKTGGMGAIMDLAAMYMEGRVVERNIPQAIYWYSQAAEKRNTFAMRKLGEIFERGIDMAPNPQEAMKWYKQAAGVPI